MREHFGHLDEGLGLNPKQIKAAFNRMINGKSSALDWIDRSFLSKNMRTAYVDVLERKYVQLG